MKPPAQPNQALERTVNGGLARWFVQTWAAPLSAAQLQRWASPSAVQTPDVTPPSAEYLAVVIAKS